MSSTVTTVSKPLNFAQLARELPGVALELTGDQLTADMPAAELRDALSKHTAQPEPEPESVEPEPSLLDRLTAVEQELRGMKGRAAAEAAKSTTTAKGVAAAIAAGSA